MAWTWSKCKLDHGVLLPLTLNKFSRIEKLDDPCGKSRSNRQTPFCRGAAILVLVNSPRVTEREWLERLPRIGVRRYIGRLESTKKGSTPASALSSLHCPVANFSPPPSQSRCRQRQFATTQMHPAPLGEGREDTERGREDGDSGATSE